MFFATKDSSFVIRGSRVPLLSEGVDAVLVTAVTGVVVTDGEDGVLVAVLLSVVVTDGEDVMIGVSVSAKLAIVALAVVVTDVLVLCSSADAVVIGFDGIAETPCKVLSAEISIDGTSVP